MKSVVITSLIIILSACCQHGQISEFDTTKCAIKNPELLAWIYKNHFENERLNDFPNNKVSSIVFVNHAKTVHALKGLIKSDTIIDISVFSESLKKIEGYKGITCLLEDTIVIFDQDNVGIKYYNPKLLKILPIDRVTIAKGKKINENAIFFALYNLYIEDDKLILWNK